MTADHEPTPDAIHVEAEARAHDRLMPDATLDAMAAVDLYVEAFVAGAKFAATQPGDTR